MTLREHRLHAKLSKYEFWLKEVILLGHVISTKRISVNPRKVKAVLKWKRPINVTEIHNFLGLTESYQNFI